MNTVFAINTILTIIVVFFLIIFDFPPFHKEGRLDYFEKLFTASILTLFLFLLFPLVGPILLLLSYKEYKRLKS